MYGRRLRESNPETKKDAPGGAFFLQLFATQRVFFFRACASALPAPDFDFALVRPSRKVDEAFVATFFDVVLLVLRCDSALPAELFDFFDVDLLLNVLDAFFAALAPVSFAMMSLDRKGNQHDCMQRAEMQESEQRTESEREFQRCR